MIQYAIAYQTAKRGRDEVQVIPKRIQRTDQFLERVTRLGVVGDFHSHPGVPIAKAYSTQLSGTDKNSMKSGNIGIVIAIDRDEKPREWRHLPKGSLMGSVYPYSLKITSWSKTEQGEFRIARIHCPFALGLER